MADLFDRYQFDPKQDLLGVGAFGETYRAFDRNRQQYIALKFYIRSDNVENDLIRELQRATEFFHPNLIRYFDVYELSDSKRFLQVGVLELASEGDFKKNRALLLSDPSQLKVVLRDVLEGLWYLEKKKMLHGDIKVENILLNREERLVAKITDFGISRSLRPVSGQSSSGGKRAFGGTPSHMAPELLDPEFAIKDTNGQAIITYNADLWSFGVMLYFLFTQEVPFGRMDDQTTLSEVFFNIRTKELDPAQIDRIPAPFDKIIRTCLVKDAKERVRSAEDLFKLLHRKTVKFIPTPRPQGDEIIIRKKK